MTVFSFTSINGTTNLKAAQFVADERYHAEHMRIRLVMLGLMTDK